jgi:hypothetical protein
LFVPKKPALTSSERQAKWYKGLSKADKKKINKKKHNNLSKVLHLKLRKRKENKSSLSDIKNHCFSTQTTL